MLRDNQDVTGEKPVKNYAGQLSLDEEAKKEAWREHYERLLNVEFPLESKRPVRRKPSWRPKRANHLGDDHKCHQQHGIWQSSRVLSLRCWSPLGKLVQWRCVISLRTSSRRDAFQRTGRKASLSICTRAKWMLWIEATTGAWSWLSKWWRCWSVWWRDSSGKELRSMRCSVASCLAVALLMQFLLYYCTSATGESLGCQQAALHGLRRPGESIWSSSTGCHLVGNAQTRNWRVAGASGPVRVQGCKKKGKSSRWVQRGVWCWSGCSSGLCP